MPWTESDIPSQTGRMAIVTGVGGLGYETARALVAAGADVVLAGRNPDAGETAVARIRSEATAASVRFEALDLARLSSVQAFAERMLAEGTPLDILVNNAGIMNPPTRQETADGFELQFGVNYLAHFALTLRLMPLLLRAPAPRVVSVASVVHRRGAIDFDDLQSTRSYKPHLAYANSKLAMLLFAQELDRRVKAHGHPNFASIAAHPGIARTDLFRHMNLTGAAKLAMKVVTSLISHPAAAGALPLLMAATATDAKGAAYYGPTGFNEMKGPPGVAKVAPQGSDATVAARLFDVSEAMTGLTLRT